MPQYKYLFKDDATTTLATGISAASSSLQVVSGGGALFPGVGASQAFIATLIKNGNPAIKEVVLVTGRSGDNMTGLVRNLSGTGALTWNAGDTFAMLQPAEIMALFAQIIDLQAQQTNYVIDTGTANAYHVTLSPALNGHVIGMPIRFKAAHTNTSATCTFHDGIGSAPLITPEGTGIPIGVIVGGGIYEAIWDGSDFELVSNPAYFFSQIAGSVSNAQVPSAAVLQWEALFSIGFTQITGTILQAQMTNSLNLPGNPTAATQAINDASTRLATTAFANPATAATIPGYFKTPGGILVQFGTANPAGGGVTVTLPVSYPSAYVVFGISVSAGAVQTWVDSSGKTLSAFILHNSGGSAYWWSVGI